MFEFSETEQDIDVFLNLDGSEVNMLFPDKTPDFRSKLLRKIKESKTKILVPVVVQQESEQGKDDSGDAPMPSKPKSPVPPPEPPRSQSSSDDVSRSVKQCVLKVLSRRVTRILRHL